MHLLGIQQHRTPVQTAFNQKLNDMISALFSGDEPVSFFFFFGVSEWSLTMLATLQYFLTRLLNTTNDLCGNRTLNLIKNMSND